MRPELGWEFLVHTLDSEFWILRQGYQFYRPRILVARVTGSSRR